MEEGEANEEEEGDKIPGQLDADGDKDDSVDEDEAEVVKDLVGENEDDTDHQIGQDNIGNDTNNDGEF